jgi:hypothetical protein
LLKNKPKKIQKKFLKVFDRTKNPFIFAAHWRIGRVVECGSLENC